MNFHNFYKYVLSDDDTDCLNFLLYDYLPINILKSNICSRKIENYVFLLIWNGLTENETLNVLIESLYHIPRKDILYECSISYELEDEFKYGKLINTRRLLMFKIFNEFEENDFYCRLKTLFSTFKITEPSVSLLHKLNAVLQSIDYQDEVLKYFSTYGNSKVQQIINDFQKYFESNQNQSEQLWNKISNNKKSEESDKVILALEKGSDVGKPSFAFNECGKLNIMPYNPHESYPCPEMDSSKSLCLIFDINGYAKYPRKGSELDTKLLRETFSNLHFTIQLYENMTKDEMFETAQNYANADLEKSGSILVCCILAHGTKDCIFDINEEKVKIREFSLIFSAKNCPSYKNKPKIFFIQACQGDQYHEGVPESILQAESSQVSALPVEIPAPNVIKITDYKMSDMIPEEADFIFGMATLPDYVAFRSTKKGSWYIRELCKMIKDQSNRIDVISILTFVNGEVSKKKYKNCCQMPSVNFTTRKMCYLTQPIKANN